MFPMQKVVMPTRIQPLAAPAPRSPCRARPRRLRLVLGCGSGKSVALVAYSTPQGAYAQLIPAFQATPEGKGVSFSQSFGPSGEQSRAVANGLHADVVNFSLEPDVDQARQGRPGVLQLEPERDARLRDELGRGDHRAQGNPKHITGWSDLIKPGVQVVTPNPFTSGSARWNIMAAYGAQLKEGKTPAQAQEYLCSCSTTWSARTARRQQRAADVPGGARRRADRLRGRGDRRPK